MIKRLLDLTCFKHSLFLFGPRQVGKSYLIKNTLSPDLYINLLVNEEYLRYSKNVSLLFAEIKKIKKEKMLVVIDEIQKCPELLNEVHHALEDIRTVQFILTGSSARKLRRAGVNLLGGRAITLHLYPLTSVELGERFTIDDALLYGTIPNIVLEDTVEDKRRLLKSYLETYLKEEIHDEALTRNMPAFSRFLELAAFENGNLLNYQNIAREVGVASRTIKEYFTILEDTLIGYFLYPYTKSHRQKLVAHPKFYFFDPGVINALKNQLSSYFIPGSPPYGMAFEHFVMIEIERMLSYHEREVKRSFFRTTDGAEVDLILEFANELWAIEIKSSDAPQMKDLGGLKSFIKDHPYKRAICLCQTPRPYVIDSIEFLNWRAFLQEL